MRIKSFSLILLVSGLSTTFSWGRELLPQDLRETSVSPSIELMGSIKSLSSIPSAGSAQMLIPLFQDEASTNLWFAHAQTHYRASSENERLETSFGLGVGYRMQLDSEFQIGAYGLFDLRFGSKKEKYSLFTPGIEVQTPLWSVSLNGYLPGKKRTSVEPIKWAHELGIETYHRFEGHEERDRRYQEAECMPMGVDLNGSWKFNKQFSLSVGGYYMKYGEEARPGARLGVAYAPTPYLQIELQGQKDAQDTQLFLQFRTSLGNATETTNRLTTFIQRPLVPISKFTTLIDSDSERKVHPYVSFYSPNGIGDGAFEQPGGTTLEQSKIDAMPEGAVIYLASGEYTLETTGNAVNIKGNSFFSFLSFGKQSTSNTVTPLILDSKSLIARSNDFRHPARSILSVPLKITGKAPDEHPMKVEGLVLVDSGDKTSSWEAGILVSDAERVQIQNIHMHNMMDHHNIATGFKVENSQNISLCNSHILANDKLIQILNSNKIKILGNEGYAFGSNIDPHMSVVILSGQAIEIKQNNFNIQNSCDLVGLFIGPEVDRLDVESNHFKIIRKADNQANSGIVGIVGYKGKDTILKNNHFEFITNLPAHTQAWTYLDDVEITQDNTPYTDSAGNTFSYTGTLLPIDMPMHTIPKTGEKGGASETPPVVVPPNKTDKDDQKQPERPPQQPPSGGGSNDEDLPPPTHDEGEHPDRPERPGEERPPDKTPPPSNPPPRPRPPDNDDRFPGPGGRWPGGHRPKS